MNGSTFRKRHVNCRDAIPFKCHKRQHSDPSVPRATVAITIIFSHYAEQHTVEIAITYFRKCQNKWLQAAISIAAGQG